MSKVTAYYHIVFCTKDRRMTIPLERKDNLYRFIWKIIQESSCDLIRIGGIQNHVHIFLNLKPTVSLAKLMQDIKSRSSNWMKESGLFPNFTGLSSGYYSCTLSPRDKKSLIEYIINQEHHHLGTPLDKEISTLYSIAGLQLDERDMR